MRRIASVAIILLAAILPPPISYQGQLLYPYYCTRTWVCDYVTEDMWRALCQQRPCKQMKGAGK
jgi:hypothetical protein